TLFRSLLFFCFLRRIFLPLSSDGCNAGKFFSFKELQHGSASCRDIADSIGKTQLVYRSYRITPTYKRICSFFSGFSYSFGNSYGTMTKFFHFKHPHRTIPYYGFGCCNHLTKYFYSFRSYIHSHPTVVYFSVLCLFGLSIVGNLVYHNTVSG